MGSVHYQIPFFPKFISIYLFTSFFLLLLFLGSWLQVHFVSAQSTLTPIPFNLYRSSDALLNEVRSLVDRHPATFTMEEMKASDTSYEAEIAIITYNNLSKNNLQNSTLRVLLSFGQHGRELITSEVALKLLHILSGEVKVPGLNDISLSRVLHDLVIKIVPMENVNGRKMVESGELCERRNGRGVDLNRNWSVDWGKKEEDYDPYEENPGSGPFSEPEAQIMQKVAHSFSPHVWVNVHSGMEGLFMPYDHKKSTPRGSTLQAMMSILKGVNRHHCHSRCIIGSGGESVGYLAHGTSTDYMYDIVKVPLAFTFEIYGDFEAPSKDCFRMFNPIDPATFTRVVDDWAAAFIWIFEEAGHRSAAIKGSRVLALSGETEEFGLGLVELKIHFRLLLMSTALLLFIIYRRILKKNRSIRMNLSPPI